MRSVFISSKFFLEVLLVLCCMASCRELTVVPDDESHYTRTIVVYIVAENSLSYGNYHEQDIVEMCNAVNCVPAHSHMVVYVDDDESPRIFSIEKDKDGVVRRDIKVFNEERDSASPETLREVMEIIVNEFPSDSYGLVMWSHGEAWLPSQRTLQRSICVDNGINSYSNAGSKMDIDEMRDALSVFPKFDFILFDACFMQAIEVAYELRDVANYLIASPAEIPNPGAPYDLMMPSMFTFPFDAEGVIDAYYTYYNSQVVSVVPGGDERFGITLSVIDCNQLDALAAISSVLVRKYIKDSMYLDLRGVQRYYPLTRSYRPEYYDMNGFMRRLVTDTVDYVCWKTCFDEAVPYKRTTSWWYSNDAYTQRIDTLHYGGVSCYVPQHNAIYRNLNEEFRTTSWYRVAGWDAVGW